MAPQLFHPPTLKYRVKLRPDGWAGAQIVGRVLSFYGKYVIDIADEYHGRPDHHQYSLKDGKRKTPPKWIEAYRICEDELPGLRELRARSTLATPDLKSDYLTVVRNDGIDPIEESLLEYFLDALVKGGKGER